MYHGKILTPINRFKFAPLLKSIIRFLLFSMQAIHKYNVFLTYTKNLLSIKGFPLLDLSHESGVSLLT
jgi:hypothetical protein